MKTTILFFALLFCGAALPAAAQVREFPAEHDHTLRSCRGRLVITPERVEYKTENKEHARTWTYAELKQIKVVSPTMLELTSYEDQRLMLGRDRVFAFKMLEGEIGPEISALLMERAARPLVTSVSPAPEGTPAFEVSVKHMHAFGGCMGTLRIFPDRIVYESKDMQSDTRYWRYGDIQNFSQSERFRFEVVTFESKFGGPKSYNFQLKGEMPARAYDYLWARVYPSKFHREEGSAKFAGRPTTPREHEAKQQ